MPFRALRSTSDIVTLKYYENEETYSGPFGGPVAAAAGGARAGRERAAELETLKKLRGGGRENRRTGRARLIGPTAARAAGPRRKACARPFFRVAPMRETGVGRLFRRFVERFSDGHAIFSRPSGRKTRRARENAL